MATESESFYKGSAEIPTHDCDVCLSNSKIVKAISYCTKCCEYMCHPCELSHRGSKASGDHTILTGINVPSGITHTKPTIPFMFCDTHKTTLINIYCTTHDVVICPACKLASHNTCDTGDVSCHSARLDVEKELGNVVNNLSDLTTKYKEFTKNRDIDNSTVKTQIKKCFSKMRQFRKDISDKLDELEKKMSFELRNFEKGMIKEIDAHVTLAGDILRQIEDLDKSVSKCQKMGENDDKYVGIKKASSRVIEYENMIVNLQKDIYPIEIRFDPDDFLADMIQQLQSLGTVASKQPIRTGRSQTSILNKYVKEMQEIDVKSFQVYGCTFMSDGHLVLACYNDGLKLFDKNFQFKSQSSFPAVNVAAINDTDVIVSEGKLLRRVRLFPDIVLKKTLAMDIYCWGVDVYGDEIYITCRDNPGHGEVRVLNMAGDVQRKFGVNEGTYKFIHPNYVKVNRDGCRIFVSDGDTDIVTCLNNQGHLIYKYSDKDLKGSDGIYVDGEDNLLVCGKDSHNVHVVRHGGGKEKVLLSEKDRIQHPMCLAYRESDGCIVVGLGKAANTDKKLIIFRIR